MCRRFCVGLAGVLLAALSAPAQSFMDDFNDGIDDGWTRYDPLPQFGAPPASYTFPNGGYRIRAGASPNPQTFGVSRAASFRLDFQYSDFVAQVDIVDWNNQLPQGFALLGRTTDVGYRTSDGYLATLQNNNALALARFDNEVATTLVFDTPLLDPTHDYRLVFRGTGGLLVASVYDLNNLTTPLSTIMANDGTYASGHVGVLSHAIAGSTGGSATDVTFDNFVSVPEPGALALLAAAVPLLLRRPAR